MRRFETSWPEDDPDAIVAERAEAIAFDIERIADALEALAAEHGDEDYEGWSF